MALVVSNPKVCPAYAEKARLAVAVPVAGLARLVPVHGHAGSRH